MRETGRRLVAGLALVVVAGLSVVLLGAAAEADGPGREPSASAPAAPAAPPPATSPVRSTTPPATPPVTPPATSPASPPATASPGPSASPTPSTTLPTASPTALPTASPTRHGPVRVDDAVLRWGVSNEANNAAFIPGTFNFFSAGRIANPGKGGQQVTKSQWRAVAGPVSIQKWDGSRWRRATWAGLSTDAAGRALDPYDNRFSGHQAVFGEGTGTVDPVAGTASLRWRGSFTLVSYSGLSFFYLSDPALEVADGVGRLTGTLSGYASSQADTSIWERVPPQRVTLADLPRVDLGAQGFTADAAYEGVEVTGVAQVLGGDHAGSFPQSWIGFTDRLGTAAFWYSSNSATDAYKPALPVTVGYAGRGDPPPPASTPTPGPATESPTADNDAPELPRPRTPRPGVQPPADLPLPGQPTGQEVPVRAAGPVVQLVSAAPGAPPAGAGGDTDRPWWLAGSGLLGLAALTAVGAFASTRR